MEKKKVKRKRTVLKRQRQTIRKRAKNLWWKKRIKDSIKKIKSLVNNKKIDEAKVEYKKIVPIIQRAGSKGIFHWRNASRKISRLYHFVNKAE